MLADYIIGHIVCFDNLGNCYLITRNAKLLLSACFNRISVNLQKGNVLLTARNGCIIAILKGLGFKRRGNYSTSIMVT